MVAFFFSPLSPKGSRIKYENLELQDYLQPSSNLKLEDQRFLFSLRCEMNVLKTNFKRNESIGSNTCIKSCMQEIDNEHLVFCKEMNKESELRFEHILNGSLEKKVEALKQAKSNEEQRKKEIPTL